MLDSVKEFVYIYVVDTILNYSTHITINYKNPIDGIEVYVNGTKGVHYHVRPATLQLSGDGIIEVGRKYYHDASDIVTEMDELFFFNQILTDEQVMAIVAHT